MEFPPVQVTISHPLQTDRSAPANLFAHTGALNSFVPRAVLEQLGIPKRFRRWFRLQVGQTIERDVGFALFSWNNHAGGASVVFAEAGDPPVLGVTALHTLGLEFDPATGGLKSADTDLFSDTLSIRPEQLFL